jgi:hypothetical protein
MFFKLWTRAPTTRIELDVIFLLGESIIAHLFHLTLM